MKTKIQSRLFLVLAVLVLLLGGCGMPEQDALESATPYPTPSRTIYLVQRGDIVITTELFGRVAPLALYTVYFQMGGHVSEVYAQLNDEVTEGQLLADLAELRDLQAKAANTRRAIRRAEIELELAQLLLDKYRAEGASSYDIRMQELQVELAQMEVEEVYESFGIEPGANALETLDAATAKARVFAPADGIIISAVSPGRMVSTTTPVFVIGDRNRLEVIADVAPGDAEKLFANMFEGMPVIVNPNSRPDVKWSGKISRLPSPYGTGDSGDRTVHVVLDETPSDGSYQIGDTVTVFIELANKTGILWLPPDAIRRAGGRTFVIVSDENGPRRVDVEIGLQTSERVEILSGLVEGQEVIGP